MVHFCIDTDGYRLGSPHAPNCGVGLIIGLVVATSCRGFGILFLPLPNCICLAKSMEPTLPYGRVSVVKLVQPGYVRAAENGDLKLAPASIFANLALATAVASLAAAAR